MSIHQATLPLCQRHYSQLLVVDVQERLAAHMPEEERVTVTSNINRLIQTAALLEVPIIATEQNAKGLGRTIAPVLKHLPPDVTITDKTCFSCCTAGGFEQALTKDQSRLQVVLAGMESHICILQTASGLQQWGYQVFVVADAICSRSPHNRRNAIERMRQGGVQITSTESVAFEWLGDFTHDQFRAVSALFK